jgi:uncharacterized membrane protein YeaQ/YmgE (transglycosylase-associated protein family)
MPLDATRVPDRHQSLPQIAASANALGGLSRRPYGRDGATPPVHISRIGDTNMGIIAWIVLGLLAGAIAKAVTPGDDPGGVIVTMLIGIAGAIIGGLIGEWVGFGGLGSFFDLRTWILAVAGSIVLLIVFRLATPVGRRRGPLTH